MLIFIAVGGVNITHHMDKDKTEPRTSQRSKQHIYLFCCVVAKPNLYT